MTRSAKEWLLISLVCYLRGHERTAGFIAHRIVDRSDASAATMITIPLSSLAQRWVESIESRWQELMR